MRGLARVARAVARGRRRAALRLWAARADLRLRRHGARLRLDVAGDVTYDRLPILQITAQGLRRPSDSGTAGLTIRLGAGLHFGRDVVLEVRPSGENRLELGDGTVLFDHARITLFDGSIRVGDGVHLRPFAMVKSSGRLTLGSRVILGQHATVHCTDRVDVGAGVGVAERVTIIDSDHAVDGSPVHPMDQPIRVAPVSIGANTFVGANAVVLRGASIGPASLVGAGALVLGGEQPGGWLLAGSPARPVRPLGAARPAGDPA